MGVYITASEVQAEGVSDFTPAQIERRIVKWEAIVERLTRNVFREISPGEITFDGTNMRFLHFNLPLISVTDIKVNSETTSLDPDEYIAHVGRQKPKDDRYNPRIELTGIRTNSIFRRRRGIFAKGYDQKITGTWGFTEPDGSTPQPVKDALLELVMKDLDGYFDQRMEGRSGEPLTALRREKTDDHELEWMEGEKSIMYVHFMPRDIYDILMMYRAPIAIGVPDPRIFLDIPENI